MSAFITCRIHPACVQEVRGLHEPGERVVHHEAQQQPLNPPVPTEPTVEEPSAFTRWRKRQWRRIKRRVLAPPMRFISEVTWKAYARLAS